MKKKAQLPVKLQPRSLEPIVLWSIVSLEQQQQQCCWILRLFSNMYSRDCDVNSLNLDARAASLSRSETGWSKIRLKVKVSSQRSLLKNKINFKLLLMRCDRIPSLRKSSVCFSQTRQESSRLKKRFRRAILSMVYLRRLGTLVSLLKQIRASTCGAQLVRELTWVVKNISAPCTNCLALKLWWACDVIKCKFH